MRLINRLKGLLWTTQEDNLWRLWQTRMRRKRFVSFERLVSSLPRPVRILDVGGTQEFWEKMAFVSDDVQITIYNLSVTPITYPGLTSMAGDARDMQEFADKEFDIVFSNSVIEHVGDIEQQRQMAQEVQRVGKRYAVQTPNRYFPIEPHVLWPLFQFFPFALNVFILTHCRSPWGWKLASEQEAKDYLRAIRLLTEKELRNLFPGAKIDKEKFFGLTKSFILSKEE